MKKTCVLGIYIQKHKSKISKGIHLLKEIGKEMKTNMSWKFLDLAIYKMNAKARWIILQWWLDGKEKSLKVVFVLEKIHGSLLIAFAHIDLIKCQDLLTWASSYGDTYIKIIVPLLLYVISKQYIICKINLTQKISHPVHLVTT